MNNFVTSHNFGNINPENENEKGSPTTPLQAPFTAIPSPSTTPSPLKILIPHKRLV